jgi:hypothetical protein
VQAAQLPPPDPGNTRPANPDPFGVSRTDAINLYSAEVTPGTRPQQA